MISKALVVAMTLTTVYSENSALPGLQCTAEGRFPVSYDCGHFYDCVPSGDNGSLVAHQYSCFGNAFDATLKECVPPQLVEGCTPNAVRSLFLEDPYLQKLCNDTQHYITCANCKSILMCIDGKQFTSQCDYGSVCSMKTNFGGGVCYPYPGGAVECACRKTHYFQQDFYDPTKYLFCGIEGSDPIIQSCPEELEFNEVRRACGTSIDDTCTAYGIFAVKDYCNKYFMCTFANGAWIHREFTCPNKTMFNEETGICEDPCIWYSGHFTCKEEGRFANPANCRKYYECFADPDYSNRIFWVEQECPEGYEWSQMSRGVGVCVKNGTANEQCEPVRPSKCKIPYDWCTEVAVTSRKVSSYSLEVEWSQKFYYPYGISNYTIKWVKSRGGSVHTAMVTESFYIITNLLPCTRYTITVTPYTDNGPGEESDSITLSTGIGGAGKSSDVRSKSFTSHSLEVDWIQPYGSECVTNYTVLHVSSSDGTTHDYTVTDPPYNITDLLPCTEYNISVIAYTEDSAGDPSDTVTLTTGIAGPGISSNIRMKSHSSHSLEVIWTPPLDNPCVTQYALWFSKSSGEGQVMEVTVTEPSYNITDLIPCTSYNITVMAFADEVSGKFSDTVILTTGIYGAGKSSHVRSKSFTSHSLEVDWNQPLERTCVTNYTIHWVSSRDGASHEYTVTEPPYNITDQIPCTKYNISVIAHTMDGPGESSDTVTLTTGIEGAGKSSNVNSKSFTSHSLEVDWIQPRERTCITNYTVQLVNNRDGSIYEYTVTEPPYNITDLTPCTKYNINVIAFTEEGPGEASETVTLTSGMYGAGKSSDVSIKSFTSHSLEVDWIQPLDSTCVTNYTVQWVSSSGGVSHTYNVTEPPYSISDLIPCTDYNISVTAHTKEDSGYPSDIVTLTTGVIAPGKISTISIDASSSELNWNLPLDNPCHISKYIVIWIKLSTGVKHEITITEPPYIIPDLTPSTEYNITVTAYTDAGPGLPSDILTFLKPEIIDCPEEEGFIRSEDTKQCFKLFTDHLNWDQAKTKCENENLQLAEPADSTAVALRKTLVEKYGSGISRAWLWGRGDGSSFKWLSGDGGIPNNSPLWWPGHPSNRVTTNYCLGLLVLEGNMNSFPTKPYHPYPCSHRYSTLCERVSG